MNARSFTRVYSDVHRSIFDIAQSHDLTPFDGRVLLALLENGGSASSPELYEGMRAEGSGVRRSSLVLRDRGMVEAEAVDGGRCRSGINFRLTLTSGGRLIASQIANRVHDTLVERQAA